MNKPVLVVMAAGMGSRYGGMKQIDPVGPNGEVIIDYSLYDAYRAGFRTVIFVIKHEIEEAFRAAIGDRISKIMEVKYAFQQLDILPTGFEVPENREKPWGTCHAVLAAKNLIDGSLSRKLQDVSAPPNNKVKIVYFNAFIINPLKLCKLLLET